MAEVTKAYDGSVQMIDSTSVRVHQHAANSKKATRIAVWAAPGGGLTTKVHALTDTRGLPLYLVLTPGQAGDCPVAERLLGRLQQGTIILADKAYDANWLRRQIKAAGAASNIPAKANRNGKPCFNASVYRARNRIELFFNKIKHFRSRHALRKACRPLSRPAQARRGSNLAPP